MATVKQKATGTSPMVTGIAGGAGISLVITLVGAVVGAFLLSGEVLGREEIGFAGTVITLIAAAAGSWFASGKIGKMKMQVCMLTGAVYYLALMAVTVLAFDGLYAGLGRGALAVFGGSAGVALLSIMNKKKPKFRIRKNAYR